MRRTLVVLACVLSAACGSDTPVSPSPTPPVAQTPPPTVANIAGTWSGRIDATHPTVGATRWTIEATLQQSGDQVTGTFRHTPTNGADLRGEIAGTLSGFGAATTFSGTTTWDAETSSGTGRCFGRATVNGSAAPPSMAWTSADVVSDTCTGTLTNVRWTLVKQ